MTTFTENYNLIKPGDEDYYDVQNYNDNFDTIDAQMMLAEEAMKEVSDKVEQVSQKIGNGDTGETIFSLLKNSSNAGVKSIQRITFDIAMNNGYVNIGIAAVNTSRCVVLLHRLLDESSFKGRYSYSLNADSFVMQSTPNSNGTTTFVVHIIEFY